MTRSDSRNMSEVITDERLNSTYEYSGLEGEDDEYEIFDFVLYKLIVPSLFGLITCLGLVGNGLVIYVIIAKERMRTVINLLLFNLAVADLSFVLVIPPFTAYQLATERWPFGNAVCKLMHYLVNVTAYVTVYTLVLVAVVRYLTVVHNVRSARFRTRPVTVALISGTWVVMCLLNVPVLLIYGEKTDSDHVPDCDLYDQSSGKNLFATFFAFGYVFPLAVIGLFSIRITVGMAENRPTVPGLRRVKSVRRKKQIGRLLVFVVVLFALLWLPVHVHLLVAFFGKIPKDRIYQVVAVAWYCLAYFNSCVNPIIYNCASRDFRLAFREAVGCKAGPKEEVDTEGHTSFRTVFIRRLTRSGRLATVEKFQFGDPEPVENGTKQVK